MPKKGNFIYRLENFTLTPEALNIPLIILSKGNNIISPGWPLRFVLSHKNY